MHGKKITSDNVNSIEWDDGYFKFCELSNFVVDGKNITSVFLSCSFISVEWYWGIFTLANFIDCKFTNCTFYGTCFSDVRFVECEFIDCHFVADNLGGECDFSGAVAYECKITNTDGFKARMK